MDTIMEFYVPGKDRKESAKQLEKFFDKKNVVNIEHGLYEYSKQYCANCNDPDIYRAVYMDRVRDLLYNCKQDKQTINEIKNKIINDDYNEYNLAFLYPEEIDADNWEKIIKRKNTTEDKINNLPTIKWKPCKDCHGTQYFFYQLQTRSADEPMTRYYVCKECGRKYKNDK